MKRILVFLPMLLLSVCLMAVKPAMDKLLTDLASGALNPKGTEKIVPMKDGEFYAKLSADGKKITKHFYKNGKEDSVLFDAEKTKGAKVEKIENFEFCENGMYMMLYVNSEKIYRHSFSADYYVFDIDRNKLEKLSTGKQRDAKLSPNGRNVVFARGRDLFIKKLDYGTEVAITKSDDSAFYNGIGDWMYEEEFRATRLFMWSPDSKQVVYVTLDMTNVGVQSFDKFGAYPFKTDKDLYPTQVKFEFAKAGTSIPKAKLYVYDIYYKVSKEIKMGEGDYYLPRMKWMNTNEEFVVFKFNRNQSQMEMTKVNSRSLVAEVLLTEKSDAYVDYQYCDYVQFTPDGKFTFVSEQDGYRHIYFYNSNGILIQQVTKGNYDVTDFYGYDSLKSTFYYQSAEKSPLHRDVYGIDLKAKKTLLSDNVGCSSAAFGSNYLYFIKNQSSTTSVPKYSVCNKLGKELNVLQDNADLAGKISAMLPKTFFKIKNETDSLNAWMIQPAGFDASKKYPVVMYQYSGAGYQEVMDEFSFGLEQYIASKGFVVVCVDGRGTGGRGTAFRNAVYSQLGVLEAKDQVAAAKVIGSLPYVDKTKIGIWGWSYGGYTTLMAMSTGEKVFAAGVAVAPLTDWRFYDAAYTERYMQRPQENVKYDASSPIALASKLEGNLLLVHGTADDNVHIQNTYTYASELVNAGKQFDMQIYPNKDHGLRGTETRSHLYTRITNFFIENLK